MNNFSLPVLDFTFYLIFNDFTKVIVTDKSLQKQPSTALWLSLCPPTPPSERLCLIRARGSTCERILIEFVFVDSDLSDELRLRANGDPWHLLPIMITVWVTSSAESRGWTSTRLSLHGQHLTPAETCKSRSTYTQPGRCIDWSSLLLLLLLLHLWT
jgi:hypothetical protein